jgi:hypothetical protein
VRQFQLLEEKTLPPLSSITETDLIIGKDPPRRALTGLIELHGAALRKDDRCCLVDQGLITDIQVTISQNDLSICTDTGVEGKYHGYSKTNLNKASDYALRAFFRHLLIERHTLEVLSLCHAL